MIVVAVVALLAVVALSSNRRQVSALSSQRPTRRYSRADVAAAVDLAVRAHPILPRWFVWAMADKESGLNPLRTNLGTPERERSYGLFQINWNAHGAELTRRGLTPQHLFEPLTNAAYWSEIADQWTRAAMSHGVTGERIWYAVRLRAAGIPWEDFGTAAAAKVIRKFRPFVDRWRARFGA